MAEKSVLATFKKAVTTAGTRVQTIASTTATYDAVIKANAANTGIIYVGDSSVSSSNGYELSAKESVSVGSLSFAQNPNDSPSIDLSTIYLDSSVNGEGVSVLYTVKVV